LDLWRPQVIELGALPSAPGPCWFVWCSRHPHDVLFTGTSPLWPGQWKVCGSLCYTCRLESVGMNTCLPEACPVDTFCNIMIVCSYLILIPAQAARSGNTHQLTLAAFHHSDLPQYFTFYLSLIQPFLAFYAGMWTVQNFVRPLRFALAVGKRLTEH
jgi:hypothetical protein